MRPTVEREKTFLKLEKFFLKLELGKRQKKKKIGAYGQRLHVSRESTFGEKSREL
jgi:hypothetical protein